MKQQNPARWDRPPFLIDESPDILYSEPEAEAESVPVPDPLSVVQDALMGLQASVDRIGRDLYKSKTRDEALLAQITRLRSDVATLLESHISEDKAVAVIKAMLPLLDGLSNIAAATQTAAANMSDGPAAEVLAYLNQVIMIVQEKGSNILKDLGVTSIEALGKTYDPHGQVVVDTTNNPDLPALLVVEEESKGYLYREQVLRPAQVIVNKPKPIPPD